MKFPNPLILFYVFLWMQTTVVLAAAAPLELRGTIEPTDTVGYVEAWHDPSNAATIADVASMPFERIAARSVDFGYTKGTIWLRLRLRNAMAAGSGWRLHFRENFFTQIQVHVAKPGAPPVLVERQGPETRFAERQFSYPDVVIPLDLPPGKDATVYVAYQSSGSSETSFSLRTADDFAMLAATRIAKNFAYYGMMLFLAIAATVAFLVTRLGVFAGYCAYAVAGFMFLMHADGNAFRYLWPEWPAFNAYASVLTGWGVIFAGSNFARQFLQTRQYHRVFDAMLLAAMIIACAMVLATVAADTQMIKKYMVLLAFISILLFTLAGLNAARTRFREVRFYVLAWTGALISSGIMMARHWLGIDISEEVQFDSMRIVTIFDAAFMGLAILDRFNQLKRARQQALESSLTAAQRSLDLSRRLQELEERYSVANELAETRGRRLTDTAHDLRQPLHALRLNVQALVENPSGGGLKATEVEETFTYLETLVTEELNAQTRSSVRPRSQPAAVSQVSAVLTRIEEMFEADAREKGLELRVVSSGQRVALPMLDLMRISGNLVSNAVKYSDAGKILVGARRRSDCIRLEVHDAGAGMSLTEFQQAMARGERLTREAGAIEGYGLGLNIVSELAAKHGLKTGLLPRPSGGTSVYVELPRATPPIEDGTQGAAVRRFVDS
ncbi:MAG: sensor histidine kinase [Pseudomonadota bacterium]